MTDLEKLCLRVTEAADCAVITDDVNRRYFTAMKSSAGTLVVFPEKAYFIIDFRYIEKAKKTVTACEVILQDKLYEQINSLIEKHGVRTVSYTDFILSLGLPTHTVLVISLCQPS